MSKLDSNFGIPKAGLVRRGSGFRALGEPGKSLAREREAKAKGGLKTRLLVEELTVTDLEADSERQLELARSISRRWIAKACAKGSEVGFKQVAVWMAVQEGLDVQGLPVGTDNGAVRPHAVGAGEE